MKMHGENIKIVKSELTFQ